MSQCTSPRANFHKNRKSTMIEKIKREKHLNRNPFDATWIVFKLIKLCCHFAPKHIRLAGKYEINGCSAELGYDFLKPQLTGASLTLAKFPVLANVICPCVNMLHALGNQISKKWAKPMAFNLVSRQ